MIQLKTALIFAGIVMCLTDMTYCELSPDLGPAGPSEGSCETYTCPENSTCKDDDGYLLCVCKNGKVGENCDIDNPCVERRDDCPQGSVCYGYCKPNIMCEAATGIAHCRGCVQGWTGLHCEKKIPKCIEIVNYCSNNGSCLDMNEGMRCICKTGWVGETCDCKQGTECDIAEIKSESADTDEHNGDIHHESKTDASTSGTQSNFICSVTVLLISVIPHIVSNVFY